MKPVLSKKSQNFKRKISPVRQIMMSADSVYFKKLGLESKKVISFAGGWVNHRAPFELQKAYQGIVSDDERALFISGLESYSGQIPQPELI